MVFKESLKSFGNVGGFQIVLFVDVHIDQVALQDCVGTHVKNANEDASYQVCEQEDDETRKEWLLDWISTRNHHLQKPVSDESSHDSDGEFCKEHENTSNAIHKCEFNCVLDDQKE